MNIHGICLIKNEADVIEQTLCSAVQWCDFIYVFDNGSTDGTWEKVLMLAEQHAQIIPYKQEACVFHDSLRSQVFHAYRWNAKAGDWWCRLDADEIYIDNPQIFLTKIPHRYQVVWSASFQYYFTDQDLQRYRQNPALYADSVPLEEKCRYYMNNWSEVRFFRDDPRLVWNPEHDWPYFGAVYPVRIWLKHYQYRSPQQIQRRIRTRLDARVQGSSLFGHEAEFQPSLNDPTAGSTCATLEPVGEDWLARVMPADQLHYDAHDNRLITREDLMLQMPAINPHLMNGIREVKRYFNRSTLKKLRGKR